MVLNNLSNSNVFADEIIENLQAGKDAFKEIMISLK
jgi:hypothetical protein